MPAAQSAAQSGVDAITPFWNRIPKFFLFPFQLDPLMYVAFLALVSLLDLIIPDIFGISIVGLGIALAAVRYAFRIVEQTALGYLSTDQYQRDAQLETTYLPYKMLGIIVIWGLVGGLASHYSPTLGVFVSIFTTLALPAVAIVLVMTGSFVQGLNPAEWLTVMRAVGSPYLALWFFLFLLLNGAGIALSALSPVLGGWLALPLVTFAYVYFTFVMANMTGYVLYQCHDQLGFAVKVDFAETRAKDGKIPSDADTTGDAIARHVASGNLEEALAIANEQQQVEPDNIRAHERYHKLLTLADHKDALLRHGTAYLGALLRKDQTHRALEVFKSLRAVNPTFESGKPGHILPLARAARGRGEHSFALTLMRGFAQRHPGDQDIPSIYLLSAQILSDHFHKDDLARKLLRQLVDKYATAPATGEARAYLQALDRIAGLRRIDTKPSGPNGA